MSNIERVARLLSIDIGEIDQSKIERVIFGLMKEDIANIYHTVIINGMSGIFEVSNYTNLLVHLIDTVDYYLNKEAEFKEYLAPLSITKDGIAIKYPPNLEILGNYGHYIAGKVSAGGNVRGNPKTAAGWMAIYIKFKDRESKFTDKKHRKNKNTKEQKHEYYLRKKAGKTALPAQSSSSTDYEEIMDARVAYWQGIKKAPFWYWFAEPADDTFAFPKQHTFALEEELYINLINYVNRINESLFKTLVIEDKIDIDKWAEHQITRMEQYAGEYGVPRLEEAYEESEYTAESATLSTGKHESPDSVYNKLLSGEYIVAKKIEETVNDSGDIIRIRRVFRIADTGRKMLTGTSFKNVIRKRF